jgi:hypothetical protein
MQLKKIIIRTSLLIIMLPFFSYAQTCNVDFVNMANCRTAQFNVISPNSSYTYTWYLDGSTDPAGYGKILTYTFKVAGDHEVKVVATTTDANGNPCTATSDKTITFYDVENTGFSYSCMGYVGSLSMEFTTVQPPAGCTITWYFADAPVEQQIIQDQTVVDHTFANPGTYQVCLEIRQSNGDNSIYCENWVCKAVCVGGDCCTGCNTVTNNNNNNQ